MHYFTTRVPGTTNTSATRTTQVRRERHECDTSATQTTQVKIFDFDKDTSENIFSHPYVSYMTNEILRGEEEQFH